MSWISTRLGVLIKVSIDLFYRDLKYLRTVLISVEIERYSTNLTDIDGGHFGINSIVRTAGIRTEI